MKKITLIILLSFVSYFTYSQCPPNSSENASVVSTNDGFVQILASDVETFEFVTVTNLSIGDNYLFTSSRSGNDDYITITNTSNAVIASGVSPLQINNISINSIRIHIRVDATCITDLFFHTLTLLDLTLEPTTCQKPELNSLGISYKSDTRIDIFWNEPVYGSVPSGYDWEIVPDGNSPGVGTVASGFVSAPTTTFSTGNVLSPSTTYDIYLRSNCVSEGFGTGEYYLTSGGNIPGFTTNSNPPPVNDFCSGSIKFIQQSGVVDSSSAIPILGTLLGGAGTDVDAESCGGNPGNARDDVWYKFVAKTSDVNITVEPNPNFDIVITLYSGDCNSLTYLDCSDNNISSPSTEEINFTGLTIGQTYYIRIYSYGSTTPATPIFNLKIWSSISATDADNDGYVESVDCNDNDPMINPETVWYLDADGDNYAISTMTQCTNPGAGYTISVLPITDCNDNDSSINPDTIWYLDADSDNFAVSTLTQCTSPGVGYTTSVLPLTDCDDTNFNINPGATEIWYDGVDQNCDLQSDYDQDGDGYDSESFGGNDCDDTKFDVNPGQTEIEGNGLDDDCNPSTPDNPLGVEEFNFDKVKVSPNPFSQSLTIQVPSGYENDNFKICIYDLNGRKILQRNIYSNNSSIIINHLSSLQQGMYFIKITSKEDNKSVVRELIKY